MTMGKLLAVCISTARGTEKHPVPQALLVENFGIQGDAHAGNWHRQVSLLSAERIAAFQARGAQVKDGAFGENLIVSGIDCKALPVGTLLQCGTALLEITQIGKECHSHCKIFQQIGDCIMPREGVFARVLRGGTIYPGQALTICSKQELKPCTA